MYTKEQLDEQRGVYRAIMRWLERDRTPSLTIAVRYPKTEGYATGDLHFRRIGGLNGNHCAESTDSTTDPVRIYYDPQWETMDKIADLINKHANKLPPKEIDAGEPTA